MKLLSALTFCGFVVGLTAHAVLPIEPATSAERLEFASNIEPSGENFSPGALMLTNVQFDEVDELLPDLRVMDADRGLNQVVEKKLLSVVDALPRSSVTLKPRRDQPIAIDGPTLRRRLVGAMTVRILSRSGLSPARSWPAGTHFSQLAIDRVGFELRTLTNPSLGQRVTRTPVFTVDARQVAVVVGRGRDELDFKMKPNARQRLVEALRAVMVPGDPERNQPRVFVHLLDLNKNDFGVYALDTALVQDLVREALDQAPVPPGIISLCRERLERKF